MFELTADNLVDALRAAGRLRPEETASVEWLSGGVSNVVFRVEASDGRSFVVKQSRARLRTQADWRSRLDRIWREADAMEALWPALPPGAVPRVLFQDRSNYAFAMEAVDRPHVVWKSELLEGIADPAVARAAANILAAIHAETFHRGDLRERFGDREVFDQLRLDPFYRYVAERNADVRRPLQQLVDLTLARSECVVHADFSPKNLLIVRSVNPASPRVALVDYETAHFGDPAFDLGFFLTHLFLKSVMHADRARAEPSEPASSSGEARGDVRALIRTFLAAYECRLSEILREHSVERWRPSESQAIAHLGGCLLARIDGKSPVDYLQERQRDTIRRHARALLLDPPKTLAEAMEMPDSPPARSP